MLTPPTTTAEIACRCRSGAITASTVPKRAPQSTPTRPHSSPDRMNTKAMWPAWSMPAKRALSGIDAEGVQVAPGARVARRPAEHGGERTASQTSSGTPATWICAMCP